MSAVAMTFLPTVTPGRAPVKLVVVRDPDGEGLELLERTAKGDTVAFAELYDVTSAKVFGCVRAVVRDRSIAEEVAHDVFIEVWRSAPRFDPARGTALTWIMTIAHRRAIDRVRREESARNRDEADVRDRVRMEQTETVADAVEGRFDRQRVDAALAQLSDLQREAVALAYFGGKTHTQIAEHLGAPLGTVKTRIRDGLIRLRALLGDIDG